MLSAFILTEGSYPAMPLVGQPAPEALAAGILRRSYFNYNLFFEKEKGPSAKIAKGPKKFKSKESRLRVPPPEENSQGSDCCRHPNASGCS